MSTIRCIYEKEPNFLATDQHPDAVRYAIKVGIYRFVDAIGGEPTAAELDAVLQPPIAARRLSNDGLAALLISKNIITQADVDKVP